MAEGTNPRFRLEKGRFWQWQRGQTHDFGSKRAVCVSAPQRRRGCHDKPCWRDCPPTSPSGTRRAPTTGRDSAPSSVPKGFSALSLLASFVWTRCLFKNPGTFVQIRKDKLRLRLENGGLWRRDKPTISARTERFTISARKGRFVAEGKDKPTISARKGRFVFQLYKRSGFMQEKRGGMGHGSRPEATMGRLAGAFARLLHQVIQTNPRFRLENEGLTHDFGSKRAVCGGGDKPMISARKGRFVFRLHKGGFHARKRGGTSTVPQPKLPWEALLDVAKRYRQTLDFGSKTTVCPFVAQDKPTISARKGRFVFQLHKGGFHARKRGGTSTVPEPKLPWEALLARLPGCCTKRADKPPISARKRRFVAKGQTHDFGSNRAVCGGGDKPTGSKRAICDGGDKPTISARKGRFVFQLHKGGFHARKGEGNESTTEAARKRAQGLRVRELRAAGCFEFGTMRLLRRHGRRDSGSLVQFLQLQGICLN